MSELASAGIFAPAMARNSTLSREGERQALGGSPEQIAGGLEESYELAADEISSDLNRFGLRAGSSPTHR